MSAIVALKLDVLQVTVMMIWLKNQHFLLHMFHICLQRAADGLHGADRGAETANSTTAVLWL